MVDATASGVVGLDIGGAGIKAARARASGAPAVAHQPLELWRSPQALAQTIAAVVGRLGGPRTPVALTMTAELADVFADKRQGVLAVLDAAATALGSRHLRVLTCDGELVELARARADPLSCAAANWLASALLVAQTRPEAILVDCGGTTTDLIPVVGGRVAARGRSDLDRLLEGELLYTGALRTNVAAILSWVPIGGRACPVAAELFAIAADAHLLRGNLTPAQCACSFPDGRGSSPAEVRARLARIVCADPPQLSEEDLQGIAAAVERAQVDAIAAALARVAQRASADAEVLAVGTGAFLARAAARRLGLALCPQSRWPAPLRGRGGEVAPAAALSVLGALELRRCAEDAGCGPARRR
jgi:probable H4MPT-linked C1 transfer pathway protein